MDKEQLYFWNSIEILISSKLPAYLKNSFHLCGFYDAASFASLEDSDIRHVEEHNRKKTLGKVAGKADGVLFLGPFFYDKPDAFEFSRGERNKIHQITEKINSIGVNEFERKYEYKYFIVDDSKVLYNPNVCGWYFYKQNDTASDPVAVENEEKNGNSNGTQLANAIYRIQTGKNESNTNRPDDTNEESEPTVEDDALGQSEYLHKLHSCLREKMTQHMIDSEADKFLAGNVSVHRKNDQIYGGINCGWCKSEDKVNNIRISLKKVHGKKKQSLYWVLSNFETHLKRCHPGELKSQAKKLKADKHEDNHIETSTEVATGIGELTLFHKTEETDASTDSVLIVNKTSVIGDGLFQTPALDDEKIAMSTEIAKNISTQITSQLTKMATFVHINDLDQYDFEYKIGSAVKSLKISHTTPNGSCLFQALAHQLSSHALNERQQKATAKKLRKNVVAYIKQNPDKFVLQLTNTCFELFQEGEQEEFDKLTKKDQELKLAELRHDFVYNKLPNEKTWGGTESLLAVSLLHQSNILVVCENETFYFIVFDVTFQNTVCIAYRDKRDHYDSITYIPQDDVYRISNILSDRIDGGLNKINKLK